MKRCNENGECMPSSCGGAAFTWRQVLSIFWDVWRAISTQYELVHEDLEKHLTRYQEPISDTRPHGYIRSEHLLIGLQFYRLVLLSRKKWLQETFQHYLTIFPGLQYPYHCRGGVNYHLCNCPGMIFPFSPFGHHYLCCSHCSLNLNSGYSYHTELWWTVHTGHQSHHLPGQQWIHLITKSIKQWWSSGDTDNVYWPMSQPLTGWYYPGCSNLVKSINTAIWYLPVVLAQFFLPLQSTMALRTLSWIQSSPLSRQAASLGFSLFLHSIPLLPAAQRQRLLVDFQGAMWLGQIMALGTVWISSYGIPHTQIQGLTCHCSGATSPQNGTLLHHPTCNSIAGQQKKFKTLPCAAFCACLWVDQDVLALLPLNCLGLVATDLVLLYCNVSFRISYRGFSEEDVPHLGRQCMQTRRASKHCTVEDQWFLCISMQELQALPQFLCWLPAHESCTHQEASQHRWTGSHGYMHADWILMYRNGH